MIRPEIVRRTALREQKAEDLLVNLSFACKRGGRCGEASQNPIGVIEIGTEPSSETVGDADNFAVPRTRAEGR